MKLLDLVARERTRRADRPHGLLPDITDEDRVKALAAFLAKVRAGNLSADDQRRAEKLEALFQSVRDYRWDLSASSGLRTSSLD